MFTLFKYIDYGLKAKQGYEAPDELLAETSFAPIEGLFIISFIVLGLVSGASLFAGFLYGYTFLKIFGFLFLGLLILDIMIFRWVKNLVEGISKKITSTLQQKIKRNEAIDVEAQDVV